MLLYGKRFLPFFILASLHVAAQDTTHAGWRQLFTGKDLTGWRHVGRGSSYVKDNSNSGVFIRIPVGPIVEVNGVKVTDYREGQPVPARKFDYEPQRGRRPDTGYIGLQNHSGSDVVDFREVAIKTL